MRKSSRLASKLLHNAASDTPKRAKRSRESNGSISEIESNTKEKPAKKRIKVEYKQQDVKTLKAEIKSEESTSAVERPRKGGRKVQKKNDIGLTCSQTDVHVHESPKGEPTSNNKFIGAHVSISGNLCNAVYDAVEIGAKAFAMFLRSQRQWKSKPLDAKVAERFRETWEAHGFSSSHILPHGIYLMNCGSPDEETLAKSRDVLVEELQRCEMLGLTLYNFHPGSTCGKISVEECIGKIAESINLAHGKTKNVITVIENMSCQGNTIGGKFEELRGIIDLVKDKSRVGVCLDTCHCFAAGYDISNKKGYDKTMTEFENTVGFEYLKGVHLNDSKGDLGCHLDRHENIGKGKIGKEGFQLVMEDERFNGIPMILETPCVSDSTYTREIKTLYSMVP